MSIRDCRCLRKELDKFIITLLFPLDSYLPYKSIQNAHTHTRTPANTYTLRTVSFRPVHLWVMLLLFRLFAGRSGGAAASACHHDCPGFRSRLGHAIFFFAYGTFYMVYCLAVIYPYIKPITTSLPPTQAAFFAKIT